MVGTRRLRDRPPDRRHAHSHRASATRSCSTNRASISIAHGRRRRTRCSGMRDNPDAADEEYARLQDAGDPGLSPRVTFDRDRRHRGALHRNAAARPADRDPARAGRQRPGRDGGGVRPRGLRRLRRAHERHRCGPPLARRLPRLRRMRRFLLRRRAGRGRGMGEVDPVQRACPRRFRSVLRARRHVRARRVQRLPDDEQRLPSSIPGGGHWPHFVRNAVGAVRGASRAGESQRSPSLFFHGMEGSRIPVATAHGEGLRRIPRRRAASRPRSRSSRCASSTIAATRPKRIRTIRMVRRKASPASRRPTAASRS